MKAFRLLLFALGSLLLASGAQAQYELSAGNFNGLYVPYNTAGAAATPSGPPTAANPAPNAGQFTGMSAVAGSSGPVNSLTVTTVRVDLYPSDKSNIVLVESHFGGVFASGVPRYALGDVITPPLVQADGVTLADANYWRGKPVLPGENFQIGGSQQTLLPEGTVTVTNASTSGTTVTVSSVPGTLVVGATLLGQPVTKIVGNNVTLGANANATIAGATVVPVTPATPFYYSPHAEKVYASQPGRVTITWITRVADGSGNYQIKAEDFAVSSNTTQPVRTIYWTEGAFDGPKVQITDGRITTVNAAYYSSVPKAVAEEVSIPGYNPSTPNLTTLSFEKFNGIGNLQAYNVEGRIFIEYLGNVRLAGNIYESIGTDVVALIRVPPVSNPTVHLGQEITPHDGDRRLIASPVLNTQQGAASFYGTVVRPDGVSTYYAERETAAPKNPDDGEPSTTDAFNKVVFYWLEEGDFSIKWPKFQDRYWQRWSPNLSDYAHYSVDAGGSTPETGVAFTAGALPQIVYQDDPAQAEASIDVTTQRLFVTFPVGADKRNRSLLKFTSGSKVWYVNLYTQAEDRAVTLSSASNVVQPATTVTVPSTAGLIDGTTVSGPGINGTATIASVTGTASYQLSQVIADATNDLTYQTVLSSTSSSTFTTTITVPSTTGLAPGMIVTGPGITGTATIVSVVDGAHLVLSQNIANATNNLTYYTTTRSATSSTVPAETTVTLGYAPSPPVAVNQWVRGPSGDLGYVTSIIDSTHFRLSQSAAQSSYSYLEFNTSPGGGGYISGVYATCTVSNVPASTTLAVDTSGLSAGMSVIGPGITGTASIVSITDGSNLVLSQNIANATNNLSFGTTVLSSTSVTTANPQIIAVGSTAGMEVGQTVTGPGISGSATIVSVTDATHYVLSQNIPDATNDLTYTKVLSSTSFTPGAQITVTVPSTAALEVGMVVSGAGILGTGTIESITDSTHFVLSAPGVTGGTNDFVYTVQSDQQRPIQNVATVGSRIDPPAGHEVGGYLSSGTSYYPDGYLNPFVVGVQAANSGAIIPVNALPGTDPETDLPKNLLTVRWFKKFNLNQPDSGFADLYVPGKVGRYSVRYASGLALDSELTGNTIASGRNATTSTLLDDGQVLVAGGDAGSGPLATAETYDPATGTWTATAGPLSTGRYAPTATRLDDGRVLVAAGYNGGVLTSAELYDPPTRTWSSAAAMGVGRYGHKATLLSDGKVLVTGGFDGGDNAITSCELYDPATNMWTSTGDLIYSRYQHSATLLPDGRVLAVGGRVGASNDYRQSAEIYDPGTGAWTLAALAASERAYHSASMLPNGKVLIAGGREDHNTVLASAELYDPASNTWTAAGSLFAGRFFQEAVELPDGRVLVVGGNGSGNTLEVYDPTINSWSQSGTLLAFREGVFGATLLNDGSVLVACGINGGQVAERISWRDNSDQIVLAQGVGTDDLTGAEADGSVYVQNDPALPGYNPNEEHAFPLPPRVYALREDLNVTTGSDYTSEPFVLVAYTDNADDRPAMHAYKVVRTDATYDFDYVATAGTALVKPYPLPLMPLPLVGSGVNRTSKDLEIIPVPDVPANGAVANDPAYKGFTFKDRKGFTWVHRGPHDGGSPTLEMKLYYLSREGFFVPGIGEPAVDTVLPFLRHASRSGQPLNINAINSNPDGSPGQEDEPLTIVYHPTWPANPPELRVGETLTLAKFGLPQVRGQASAQVLYEQSIAQDSAATEATSDRKSSVTLHDPTREKIAALGEPGVTLTALPDTILTTSYQGKTYFQGLPPHLQQRFYFNPLRGTKGTLVLIGAFHDEAAGEDYLDLNLLTIAEENLVKGLVPVGVTDKAKWDAAIDALNTRVETFKPDPAQFGSYIVDSNKNADVGENEITRITDQNTAVDSYAVTATGQGTGFVTMVFGDGNAFTPEGDPVAVQVFKIADQLYVGDMKVVTSSNPLDEQVTLRHSGDFAGKPEEYEFEWRWATGAASAPKTYSTVMTQRIGDPAAVPAPTDKWFLVSDPGALRPTDAQYSAAGSAVAWLTRNVRPVNYVLDAQNQPTSTVIDATSYTAAEIAAGFPSIVAKSSVGVDFSTGVPGEIVFSARLGSFDGCVFYVNGHPALAFNAPTPQFTLSNSSSGLTPTGVTDSTLKQFSIAPSYFTAGLNTIEVAIYTTADPNAQSALNFLIEAAEETDLVDAAVTPATQWQIPAAGDTNTAIVGGSPSNPFGGPQFVLNDRWFTVRYRPKASANNVLGTPYSRWMPPQFVEGWIKRVLAAINPFEQRVKDLYNNAVNTDVSVLAQAGTRWEGDVALTLDNINDVGLIAIYETVLNRGKNLSINANTNDPDTNNALTLAAGYLNDLYTILGNEAYADGANPTISLDDQTTVTEVNSSRFSFEGQVANSLDEELALLKGRDDFTTRIDVAPAYNRLYWNYTQGINGGEVIYAINYNIKEKVGSSTANGVIDEEDAQRMFPQGHGDAYGHYLTALTGYYKLLTNLNFTWTPRAEAVTVLGQPVTVDFQDERKFAAAAGNVARTAEQVVGLTYRQSYQDDPAAGWASFRDSKGTNTSTNVTSAQGLDEWVSRSTQGALFHWAVANALVPDVDDYHSGVQKIDRTTVPEITQLATAGTTFQTTIDNANAHLNPLGLSPGAIAFDISPTEMKAGKSHFEQIYERSLRSLVNANGAFSQAGRMTRSLRSQENQLDDYNTVIEQQEGAYVNELIDIFGRPYSGEIGAGKTYSQDYDGPDLLHWFIVDRPNDLVDTTEPIEITITSPIDYSLFTGNRIDDLVKTLEPVGSVDQTVTVHPSQWVQYNDVWKSGGLGSRAETGALQDALQEAQQSYLALSNLSGGYRDTASSLKRAIEVFNSTVESHASQLSAMGASHSKIEDLRGVVLALNSAADGLELAAGFAKDAAEATKESVPKVTGVIAGTASGFIADVTSAIRGFAKFVGANLSNVLKGLALASKVAAGGTEIAILNEEHGLERKLAALGFSNEELQSAYELESLYREHTGHSDELMQLTITHQRALQNVQNVLAKGNRILADREVFRQRAAAIIQGYRTNDLGFRIFRNEALEQYRTLFDLASRYTYLAAKSYDYETGLLGSTAGQTVFEKIVASRSLGDLTGGVPQSTVSTLGDAGLAGSMAQMNADFSVAEGRLGINNPDQYGTVFSLRGELFRIRTDAALVSDDDQWRQTIEQFIVANLMNDSDVATQCRNLKKPDGTPVPGIIIPFSTSILHSKNYFGLPLAAGDHAFTPGNFSTKIYNVGVALPGYVGMDSYAAGNMGAGAPASNDPNALSATPYVYLIPCGNDYMLAPPLGDTNTLRSWAVKDQALPLPYNLGATSFNSTQFFNANGTLSEQPWILRKHQPFRPVDDATFFYSTVPAEFTNSRLIGRSVWNGQWKLVIPAYTLLNNEQTGLDRFAASVRDIQLFLRTYSHSGN